MSSIKLQKGDYVSRADVEQYVQYFKLDEKEVWEDIANAFKQEGCNKGESYFYYTAKDLFCFGWSNWTNALYWDTCSSALTRQIGVAELLNPPIMAGTPTRLDADDVIASIQLSFDTETVEGNGVNYTTLLEDTMNNPLTWMTAIDEFTKLLRQGGYIFDDENLARYFNNKLGG